MNARMKNIMDTHMLIWPAAKLELLEPLKSRTVSLA